MKLNLISQFSARNLKGCMAVLLAVLLTACGGGNGGAGSPIGSGGSGSSGSGSGSGSGGNTKAGLALVLSSGTSCAALTVTNTCPLTASATLTDTNGKPVPNQIVTFTDSLGLTVLEPASGATLTNANGVATVQVAVAPNTTSNQSGSAGTISVSATVGTATYTANKNFSLGNTAVTLQIVTPTTSPFNLNAYGSTTIAVQVSAGGAAYTAQPVTVNFSSICANESPARASFPATASTINGQAIVTYTDNGCGIADTVTASVSGSSASVTINVAPPNVGSINFISANPSDASIVFLGSGGASRTSTAILTFAVVDTYGNPMAGKSVSFSNNNPTLATLGNSTGTTGSNGQVSTTVMAVGASGTPPVYPAAGTLAVTAQAQVQASPSIMVSAISSNVVVSTGVPIQAAMSLVPAVHNIEGSDYFGTTTSLNFFLSDSNGNPVVDGTPVAATTNEGGVSGANGSSPGCTTVNGQCKLTFTTQNPTTDTLNGVAQWGIATITGTSTNNTTVPLSSTITVYMSGSYPYFYTYDGTSFTWVEGGTFSLAPGACSGYATLYLSDEYGNPMAKGTSISVAAITTGLVIGSYTPTSVPDDGRYLADQATVSPSTKLSNYASLPLDALTHKLDFNVNIFATRIDIPITAPATCTGTGKNTAAFSVTITTPVTKTSYTADFGINY